MWLLRMICYVLQTAWVVVPLSARETEFVYTMADQGFLPLLGRLLVMGAKMADGSMVVHASDEGSNKGAAAGAAAGGAAGEANAEQAHSLMLPTLRAIGNFVSVPMQEGDVRPGALVALAVAQDGFLSILCLALGAGPHLHRAFKKEVG